MVRNFSKTYDKIFVDIDNTLVYGFWTDLMYITWELFHSEKLGALLMMLQAKYGLFKVNRKLVHALSKDWSKVCFLTVRSPNPYTVLLLHKVTGLWMFELYSLGTEQGKYEKTHKILEQQLAFPELKRVCIIDDNKGIRDYAMLNNIDAFDPVAMRECVK